MTHQTLPVRWALRRMPAELQRLPDQVLLQVKLAPPYPYRLQSIKSQNTV